MTQSNRRPKRNSEINTLSSNWGSFTRIWWKGSTTTRSKGFRRSRNLFVSSWTRYKMTSSTRRKARRSKSRKSRKTPEATRANRTRNTENLKTMMPTAASTACCMDQIHLWTQILSSRKYYQHYQVIQIWRSSSRGFCQRMTKKRSTTCRLPFNRFVPTSICWTKTTPQEAKRSRLATMRQQSSVRGNVNHTKAFSNCSNSTEKLRSRAWSRDQLQEARRLPLQRSAPQAKSSSRLWAKRSWPSPRTIRNTWHKISKTRTRSYKTQPATATNLLNLTSLQLKWVSSSHWSPKR